MKVNYKKVFDKEINSIKAMDKKPTLLLHACCAPCSSAVLELLNEIFDITLFFYNPNIYPQEEFLFRLDELERLTKAMALDKINTVAPKYDYSEFQEISKGMEEMPEGGARCAKCYFLRLDKAASYAKAEKFDYFTTTLSISPYKNAAWLNEIGLKLQDEYDVKYLCADFKKGDGYKRSCTLSKEFNLYRQDYCGCIYSKRIREEEKNEKKYNESN